MTGIEPAKGFDAARFCKRYLAEGHSAALGLRYVGSGDGWIELVLPVRDGLRGFDGDLSDAAVTSLLDMAGTISVWVKSGAWWPHATLDMRMDWIRDFSPDTELLGRACCEVIRGDIAYVTGEAHDAENRRLARFTATYMMTG